MIHALIESASSDIEHSAPQSFESRKTEVAAVAEPRSASRSTPSTGHGSAGMKPDFQSERWELAGAAS